MKKLNHPRRSSAWNIRQLGYQAARRSIFSVLIILSCSSAYSQESRLGAVLPAKGLQMVMPIPDGVRGKQIFVNRGCVICHAVNGVGGKLAPALDAKAGERTIKPFEFMARMWRGASEMIRLQSMELGYRIDFQGDELAHLFGFLSDHSVQKSFASDDIPDLIRDMITTDSKHWSDKLEKLRQ